QQQIREAKLELVWSYILDFENAANPYSERQEAIAHWRNFACMDIEESADILHEAELLTHTNLKPKDSLHLACAIAGNCSHFITTDDELIRHGKGELRINIIDPTAFVREIN
ncbi:MAG: PIN domain-containing protein, partial [Planctomycetaceae bacterium]